jgi:lipoate-protein ligase A
MHVDFKNSDWRVIFDKPANGALNMAVDEAILESVVIGGSLPTLRLYAWEPPCVSLGYAQPVSDVSMVELSKRDYELVRRPTGGRAILHTDELTYSVSGPLDEPRLAGGVLKSYNILAQALLRALQSLGVPAVSEERSQDQSRIEGEKNNPVCFEVPSTYEITFGGKKLIGSAQARRKGGVLQHGTLPLKGDLTRLIQVLIFPDQESRMDAAFRLLDKAATIQDVTSNLVEWDTAAQAFADAFSKVLNLNLIVGNLSESEAKRAGELTDKKYLNPEWINRV